MKRTLLVYLAVVAVLYIVLNYQLAAQQQLAPQAPTTVRYSEVRATGAQVSGRIVGFSCVDGSGSQGAPLVKCYVATTD